MRIQFSIALAILFGHVAAQAPPTPGRLIDIGGQRFHLNCTGAGSPTVLLESGAGDISVIWALVQPEVARTTRVCSYDRGGYAWSDPGARPRTFAQLAPELRTALERARVSGPYLLVGQSYGGLVVRGFAQRYSREVAGMVLVDAVREDQHSVWGGEAHLLRASARGRPYPEPHIALDTEFVRRGRAPASGSNDPLEAPLDRLPHAAQTIWRWAESLPMSGLAREAEMDWSPEEMQRMHDARIGKRATLGTLPLIVLARTDGGYDNGLNISADSLERERRALQADLAALSMRGTLLFASRSGHNIHLEDPALVIRTILQLVGQLRHQVR